jgi:hypothetical protein
MPSTMPATPADAEIITLIEDPATSDWAREALRQALQRDCVDAASEAAVIADVLERRAVAHLAALTAMASKGHRPAPGLHQDRLT